MKIYRFILVLVIKSLLCFTQTNLTTLKFDQSIEITIELGQHYQAAIPRFFDFHQSTSISSFIHDNISIDLKQGQLPAFQVLTKQNNTLRRQNQLFHYGLSDPDEYFSGNKKIYRFADLKKLIGVLDVVQFNNQIIVLFQSGYYSFFSLEEQQLTLKQTKRLLSNITNITEYDKLSYSMATLNFWGNIIKSQDGQQLVFVGEEKVFMFDKNKKSFEQLKNYNPKLGVSLEKAILIDNQIVCAAGGNGIQIYTIDFDNMQLKFSRYYKPAIIENLLKPTQLTDLTLVDIVYDEKLQQVIVVDEIEGIFWLKIPESKHPVELVCEQKGVLIQNCQKLELVPQLNIAIALCPKLVIVDLSTKQHQVIEEIAFTPTQMTVNNTKVYLFSKNQYAIYDLKDRSLQQGMTGFEIDFSLIVNQSLLTINKFSIAQSRPVLQNKTFYISFDRPEDLQFVGDNQLSIVFQGKCSDVLSLEKIVQHQFVQQNMNTLNTNQVSKLSSFFKQSQGQCQIIQPLIIHVTNTADPSHILEIIFSSLLAVITILGALFYWNQNRQIRKHYQALVQEKKSIKIQNDIQSAYTLDPKGKTDL